MESDISLKENLTRLMRSLTTKLVIITIIIALVSITLMAGLANYTIKSQFGSYLQREPAGQIMRPGTGMQQLMQHIMGPSEERFLEAVNTSMWIAALVVVIIAVLASLIFASRITSPVKQLTKAARKIAAGEFDQRIPVKSNDEIGEMAKTFNSMAETLEKNEKLNRQLYAGIAHELKTPLTLIQGNLEAILDGIVKPNPKQIAALHTETMLLNRLVNDLRDLTLAQAGQLKLQKKPIDLNGLTRNVIESIQPMLSEKNIRMTVSIPSRLPQIIADPDRITQVLYNLIGNALRYTPEDGKIEVSVKISPGTASELTVYVSDTGEGIPDKDLPYVFNHFYRVDQARTRTKGGTGVGLAIVKHLVEAHNGNVGVESTKGRGSTFFFTLPISQIPSSDQ